MSARLRIGLLFLLLLIVSGGWYWWEVRLSSENEAPFEDGGHLVQETNDVVLSEDGVMDVEPSVSPRIMDVEVYQYGYRPDPLELKAGETVLLRFTATDVDHSFSMFDEGFEELNLYLPAGETVEKEFVVPSMPGDYVVACEIFCGSGHSDMTGIVRVLE